MWSDFVNEGEYWNGTLPNSPQESEESERPEFRCPVPPPHPFLKEPVVWCENVPSLCSKAACFKMPDRENKYVVLPLNLYTLLRRYIKRTETNECWIVDGAQLHFLHGENS